VRQWVYYCVDDFSQWPGLDRKAMARMERLVVERADTIIAVSEPLQERLRRMGRESELLTHGVDVDFWQSTADSTPMLDGLPRPLVVFWGVIDRRMDTAFIKHLAAKMTEGTIVLVGPEQDADPELTLPRFVGTGPVLFEQLPAIAREAAVLIMPYADLPVTRAMQPLKLKEYLATGKPVVVRELPATREWADCLDLVNDANEFAERVLLRIREGNTAAQASGRDRLGDESWSAKARAFERLLYDPLKRVSTNEAALITIGS
jgi:glycosyltransferase involved in cell wall biosynthesis